MDKILQAKDSRQAADEVFAASTTWCSCDDEKTAVKMSFKMCRWLVFSPAGSSLSSTRGTSRRSKTPFLILHYLGPVVLLIYAQVSV